MHLLALEDESKHLRLGQVPKTKREHHNRKRAIPRNVVSSGDFISTNRNILARINTEAQSWRG